MISPYQLHITAHTTYPKLPSILDGHPLHLQSEETPHNKQEWQFIPSNYKPTQTGQHCLLL
jgi:hypothetical protein